MQNANEDAPIRAYWVGPAHGTINILKSDRKMATLRDLCKEVPQTIDRMAVERELLRRKNATYLKRVAALWAEENVFALCQTRRPKKGNRNRYSSEEAGTSGAVTIGIRTGRYSVCVCKSKRQY